MRLCLSFLVYLAVFSLASYLFKNWGLGGMWAAEPSTHRPTFQLFEMMLGVAILARNTDVRQRNMWDYQFSLQIEDWIADWWEQTYQLRMLLRGTGVTIRAGDTKWTLEQAKVVGEAVQHIADRFEGNTRPVIAGAVIILRTKADPWWAPLWRWRNRKPAGYRFGAYENRGKICMSANSVNVGGLLHEMGHYYDEKNRLSRAYQAYVKKAGLEIETNRFEDFANAFRDYVLGRPMAAARRDYLEQLRIQQTGISF